MLMNKMYTCYILQSQRNKTGRFMYQKKFEVYWNIEEMLKCNFNAHDYDSMADPVSSFSVFKCGKY